MFLPEGYQLRRAVDKGESSLWAAVAVDNKTWDENLSV